MLNKKNTGFMKNPYVIIGLILASLIVVSLVVAFSVGASWLGSDKIYEGIYVAGVDVGGLTPEEACDELSSKIKIDTDKTLVLSCEGAVEEIPASELCSEIDFSKMAEEAYSYARYGSTFERIKLIYGLKKSEKVEIPFSAEINEELLYTYTDKLTEAVGRPMEDVTAEVIGENLAVTPGKPGLEIKRETAKNAVLESLIKGEYEISLKLEESLPTPITADEIYERFCQEAKDAQIAEENNEIKYIDEQVGYSFKKEDVEKAIKENGEKIVFPVSITEPEVTKESLRAKLFRDELASYRSNYNEGVVGRSHNVKLATKYINGTILMPGEVFSYNETVGPRTVARGFREANVYVGDQVETGIGGGICQVSSTLFNTVVLSGLDIVTRTSHSLPVSYVPLGRDATVSYGSVDFKFKNPYDMPVKIVASASGGVNTVKIYGTNENPGRKISIETQQNGTIPFETKKTEDNTLPEGTVKIETRGVNGSYYSTYKVVTENGSVVSRALLTKSTYRPTAQKEIIGTKPQEAESVEPAVGTIDESETQGVQGETLENPPAEEILGEDVGVGPAEDDTQKIDAPGEIEEESAQSAIKPVSPALE